MTDDEKKALEARIQAATKKVLEEEVEVSLRQSRKELDQMVRAAIRDALISQKSEIQTKVLVWLGKNIDPSIEVAGKQMIDEAIGAIRRRVLGRDG